MARAALALVLAVATTWGALALWYQLPATTAIRTVVAVLWVVCGAVAGVAMWRGHGKPLAAFACGLVALLGWWSTLQPSHERQWADDVARLLQADVDGRRLVLHNVRNFQWRGETDYTPRWETREYDLDTLVSGDLILSYWMGPAIAHTLLSFGFEDGRRLVFSLEIRKEHDEAFSAIGGFFREFEMVLVAADERDIVRVRSNVRGEQVRLYRLHVPPAKLRSLLLQYAVQANQLRERPRFYNTLTSNCTTIIYDLARHVSPGLPVDYRLLLSGYFAEYVYDLGALAPGHGFAELQARGDITRRARAVTDVDRFSAAIRRGVPGIPARETQP